jgi:hypothetical protein
MLTQMSRLINSKRLLSYLKNIGSNEKSPHIYIIKEREFIRLDEDTYKIGETRNPHRRFFGYAKSSELQYFCRVDDVHFVEQTAKSRFKDLFQQKREYGTEYFNGNILEMMTEMDKIICQCSISKTVTPGLRFLLKKIFKPLPQLPVTNQISKSNTKTFIVKQISNCKINPPTVTLNKHECPKCSKILASTRGLQKHLERKVPCDKVCRVCNYEARDRFQYNRHQKNEHQKPQKHYSAHAPKQGTIFSCKRCSQTFTTQNWLDHHLSKPIPCDLKCKFCDFKGENRFQYHRHQKAKHSQN